jgi:predicted RNase H-like HicB family nuclease
MGKVRLMFELPVEYYRDDEVGMWVAGSTHLKVYSQAETQENAFEAITSALKMYVETCYARGILDNLLNAAGFRKVEQSNGAGSFIDDVNAMVKNVPIELLLEAKQAGRLEAR